MANITVQAAGYEATVDGDKVSISRDGVWSGTGRWIGTRIEDCTANLGDDVYDALDDAIAAVL